MNTFEAFYDELSKIAKTRSVKEWQAATAAGDQGTADQIAQASGKLGLKPRQLQDVSSGGAEAGVDLMMGHKTVPGTGEANQSGYVARKLYKPDSPVSRGEFTPKLLEQKQQMTNAARALSPEAKQMVPAMYGHETHGEGPLQRTTSYHEYVPGVSDLRGAKQEVGGRDVYKNPRAQYMGDINKVNETVINPMEAQGQHMMDTTKIRSSSGGLGTNWGNVVGSKQGPKVLDFLPHNANRPISENHALGSMQAYQPKGDSKFGPDVAAGQNPNVGALRKEVFNPQMKIEKAPQTAAPAQSGVQPVAKPAFAGNDVATTVPQAKSLPRAAPAAAAPALAATGTTGHAMQSMGTAAPFQLMKKAPGLGGAVGGVLQKAEGSIAAKAPGMLGRIGKFFGR
jgi:hypothetical protein